MLSAFSENPNAAYSFLALMALTPVSMRNAQTGWTGVDPGYTYQFLEPHGEAKLEEYANAGWHPYDVQDCPQAYYENFTAPTMLTYPRIEGAPEHWDTMDKNLSAAMSGAKTAQQTLDDIAQSWEEITHRLGRERILRQYQEAIGYNG